MSFIYRIRLLFLYLVFFSAFTFRTFLRIFVPFYKPHSQLRYRFSKPKKTDPPKPLIVLLHGCLQKAKDIEYISKMKTYRKKYGYFLLSPEQRWGFNIMNCWNWFDPENQKPHQGNLKDILELIQKITSKYNIDPQQIYVAGLSSGAGLASSLLINHPEVFAGGLLHSGPAFASSQNMLTAAHILKQGPPAISSNPNYLKKLTDSNKKIMLVHGNLDGIVHPKHLIKSTEQLTSHLEKSNKIVINFPDLPHAWAGGRKGPFSSPDFPDVTLKFLDFIFQK